MTRNQVVLTVKHHDQKRIAKFTVRYSRDIGLIVIRQGVYIFIGVGWLIC